MKRLILAFFCILALARPTSASTIEWEWNGTVTGGNGFAAPLPPLTPFRLDVFFQSDQPNLLTLCGPDHGVYRYDTAVLYLLGETYVAHGAGGIESNATNANCTNFHDAFFHMFSFAPSSGYNFDPSTTDPLHFYGIGEMQLQVPSPAVLGALPTTLTPGYVSTVAWLAVPGTAQAGIAQGRASITAVPEPATFLLMSSAGFVAYRRRKKHQTIL